MASEDQIRDVRERVAEPDDSNGWSDERLGRVIDDSTTLNAAAARVWSEKAAVFAELVDVSESGSSRKLSDLRKNALEMSTHYGSLDGAAAEAASAPVIARMRRRL